MLIFGAAVTQEALEIKRVLDNFEMVSGQIVGPKKSNLWFSAATGDEVRGRILTILGVPRENKSDTYLGAPVSTSRGSYDFLLDKFASRLQTWKSKALSQAGRVVLIKSVLQSIPVYFMGTIKVPVSVTKDLTALTRRFFWGAMDKKKFMCYVAWSKITLPLQMGGLAIRDLNSVNDALLMKALGDQKRYGSN